MRLCFFDGLDRIEVGGRASFAHDSFVMQRQRSDYEARALKIVLHDQWQAQSFVRRFGQSVGGVQRLRILLSSQSHLVHLLRDEEVLQQIAHNLQNGNLSAYLYKHEPVAHVRVPVSNAMAPIFVPVRMSAMAKAQPSTAVLASPMGNPAPVAVEPEPEPYNSVEQDSEAAKLEAAAVEAIPFIEVCRFEKPGVQV